MHSCVLNQYPLSFVQQLLNDHVKNHSELSNELLRYEGPRIRLSSDLQSKKMRPSKYFNPKNVQVVIPGECIVLKVLFKKHSASIAYQTTNRYSIFQKIFKCNKECTACSNNTSYYNNYQRSLESNEIVNYSQTETIPILERPPMFDLLPQFSFARTLVQFIYDDHENKCCRHVGKSLKADVIKYLETNSDILFRSKELVISMDDHSPTIVDNIAVMLLKAIQFKSFPFVEKLSINFPIYPEDGIVELCHLFPSIQALHLQTLRAISVFLQRWDKETKMGCRKSIESTTDSDFWYQSETKSKLKELYLSISDRAYLDEDVLSCKGYPKLVYFDELHTLSIEQETCERKSINFVWDENLKLYCHRTLKKLYLWGDIHFKSLDESLRQNLEHLTLYKVIMNSLHTGPIKIKVDNSNDPNGPNGPDGPNNLGMPLLKSLCMIKCKYDKTLFADCGTIKKEEEDVFLDATTTNASSSSLVSVRMDHLPDLEEILFYQNIYGYYKSVCDNVIIRVRSFQLDLNKWSQMKWRRLFILDKFTISNGPTNISELEEVIVKSMEPDYLPFIGPDTRLQTMGWNIQKEILMKSLSVCHPHDLQIKYYSIKSERKHVTEKYLTTHNYPTRKKMMNVVAGRRYIDLHFLKQCKQLHLDNYYIDFVNLKDLLKQSCHPSTIFLRFDKRSHLFMDDINHEKGTNEQDSDDGDERDKGNTHDKLEFDITQLTALQENDIVYIEGAKIKGFEDYFGGKQGTQPDCSFIENVHRQINKAYATSFQKHKSNIIIDVIQQILYESQFLPDSLSCRRPPIIIFYNCKFIDVDSQKMFYLLQTYYCYFTIIHL